MVHMGSRRVGVEEEIGEQEGVVREVTSDE